MHTTLCGHATGSPEAYVEAAAQRGIEVIVFTDHMPLDNEDFGGRRIRMAGKDINAYNRIVSEAKAYAVGLGVRVLRGIEAEIFPDPSITSDTAAFLREQRFDFVLGSLHHQLLAYQKWLEKHAVTDPWQIIDTYFAHLTDGVRTGLYHSIAHSDLIRIYGTVPMGAFDPAEHETRIRDFLAELVRCDVCLEVNTSGLTKEAFTLHPDPQILRWAYEMGVKLTLGSDAHRPEAVGQEFAKVVPMLHDLGFRKLHYFVNGQCQSAQMKRTIQAGNPMKNSLFTARRNRRMAAMV